MGEWCCLRSLFGFFVGVLSSSLNTKSVVVVGSGDEGGCGGGGDSDDDRISTSMVASKFGLHQFGQPLDHVPVSTLSPTFFALLLIYFQ